MPEILAKIDIAQDLFKQRIHWILQNGGMSVEMYQRLLSLEYHLTKNVQRHFLIAASHPDLASRKNLRKFLFDFANEEEPHYLIAQKDLARLGLEPTPCPIDIDLWKAYFDRVIYDRPFLRLGGTCILENITVKAREATARLIQTSKFLNAKNTRFIVLHQHSADLPHGDQILAALTEAKLDEAQLADVIEGSRTATLIFIRLIDWCISGDELHQSMQMYQPRAQAA